jgi:hypothetical protein
VDRTSFLPFCGLPRWWGGDNSFTCFRRKSDINYGKWDKQYNVPPLAADRIAEQVKAEVELHDRELRKQKGYA